MAAPVLCGFGCGEGRPGGGKGRVRGSEKGSGSECGDEARGSVATQSRVRLPGMARRRIRRRIKDKDERRDSAR